MIDGWGSRIKAEPLRIAQKSGERPGTGAWAGAPVWLGWMRDTLGQKGWDSSYLLSFWLQRYRLLPQPDLRMQPLWDALPAMGESLN